MSQINSLAVVVGLVVVLVGLGAVDSTARAGESEGAPDDSALEYSHLELGIGGEYTLWSPSGRTTFRFRWHERFSLGASLLWLGSPFGAENEYGLVGPTLSAGMWTGNERMQVGFDVGVSAGHRQRIILEPERRQRRTGEFYVAGLLDPRIRWQIVPGFALGVNIPVLVNIGSFGVGSDGALLFHAAFGGPLGPSEK